MIRNQSDILLEVKNFYKDLYRTRDDTLDDIELSDVIDQTSIPMLTNDQKQLLDSPVSYEEILNSLKKQKNYKTPGTSGFQAGFFKFLVRSIQRSIVKGELSYSQKLGIISILPKGNKPREELKNWCPIKLLNTSYKIFSALSAIDLKQFWIN